MGCSEKKRLVGSSDPSLFDELPQQQFRESIRSKRCKSLLLVNESSNIHRDKCYDKRARNVVSPRIVACNLHIYIYICGDVSRIRGRGKIYVGPSAGNKSSDRVLNFDSTDQVGSGGETDAREWWMIVSDKLTESKIDVHAFVPSHPPSSMLNFPAVKLTT